MSGCDDIFFLVARPPPKMQEIYQINFSAFIFFFVPKNFFLSRHVDFHVKISLLGFFGVLGLRIIGWDQTRPWHPKARPDLV